jgi:hypothetical protein
MEILRKDSNHLQLTTGRNYKSTQLNAFFKLVKCRKTGSLNTDSEILQQEIKYDSRMEVATSQHKTILFCSLMTCVSIVSKNNLFCRRFRSTFLPHAVFAKGLLIIRLSLLFHLPDFKGLKVEGDFHFGPYRCTITQIHAKVKSNFKMFKKKKAQLCKYFYITLK